MISLGSSTWGTAPVIGVSFAYEKQRNGADMKYRAKVTINAVSGLSYYGYPIYLKLTIAGELRATVTLKNANPSQWTSAIVYTSDWYTVSNKTSGTTAVSFNIYSGMGSNRNSTYSYMMETDPAASEITASGVTLGNPMAISIKRYNTAFTDTITYTCGSVKGTIATKTANTSVSWTPPKSLAAQSGGKSVSIELVCSTYNGNTLLGTNRTIVNCTVPSGLDPTCMLAVGDQLGYTEMYGAMVQGKSRFSVAVTGTPNANSLAPIRAYEVNINGVVYSSDLFVTDVVTWSGTKTITATVTDAFGNTANDSLNVTVLPYAAPVISLYCQRCDENGTVNDQGEYIKATYSATVAELNGYNTTKCLLKYKKSSEAKYSTITVSKNGTTVFEADTGSSYDVLYEVTDDFSTVNRSQEVSTAQTILHIRADGTGVAFGKVSEKANADEFDRPVYFHKGLLDSFGKDVRNGLAYYLGGGAVDANTTTEELILSTVNTPTTGFWFVRTHFYAGKTATSRRAQYAIPYAGKLGMFYRYYDTAWSGWISVDAPITSVIGDGYGHMIFADGRKVCWGKVAITPTAANVVTSVAINFPVTFTKAPNITAMPQTNVPHVITHGVGAGTTAADALTKMFIYMTRTNLNATTFCWRAEGY